MSRTIGVLATEHVAVAVVENHEIIGAMRLYPEAGRSGDPIAEMPAEEIAQRIQSEIEAAMKGHEISAIGVGVPGIIRAGVIEESPNLQQLKGLNLQCNLAAAFTGIPVLIVNDADAVAAGIAAIHGQLDKLIRVWTLGTGIGYGRYPRSEGIWEGGHCVVTLDPKERYCGCGGEGHVEGIMGHRAMRLRFLDLEPDEVFANARAGDDRCRQFVKLWHRALAGATASSIHLDGPGKFFISGPSARYVDSALLNLYLHEMVKMSTLQGSFLEVSPVTDEVAVIGAAISSERAASGTDWVG